MAASPKFTSRYYHRQADVLSVLGVSAVDRGTGNFDLFTFARDFEEENLYLDLNMTSPHWIAGMDTEFVVGAEYRETEQTALQQFDFGAGTQNIFDFDPGSIPRATITFPGVGPGFNLSARTETEEYGLYGQVRVEVLDGLKLNVGGRLSRYESSVRDLGRGSLSSIEETNFAPYAGITYDITDEVTVYASYASIFQPQTELQADGSNVEPRIGDQYEAGVKGVFFEGDLIAQASVYHIRDKNRATEDPANVGFFVGTEDADTRGFELSVAGSPYPGFEVGLSYAHVDTDLSNDPTSPNNVVAFGKYTFDEGTFSGLSLGLGMRAADGFSIRDGAVKIEADSYAVFDAFLGYEINEHASVQANVRNLFDTKYYERVNEVIRGNFYGAPLHATVRLNLKF